MSLVGPSGGLVGPGGGLVGPGAGGEVLLAGASNGASSVAGVLTNLALLFGASDGTSSVSGYLTSVTVLAGSSAGTSTVAGFMPAEHVYTSVLGTLDSQLGWIVYNQPAPELEAGALYGRADAVASVSAHLTAIDLLKAVSSGVATVTGHVTGDVLLAGSAAGASAVSGVLYQEQLLVGSSAGTSTVAGLLRRTIGLAATVNSVATVSGVLTLPVRLAGTVNGVSVVSASLLLSRNLAGSSHGQAVVDGFITESGPRFLVGAAYGDSLVHGALTGGTVSSGMQVISPQTSSPTTAPSSAGALTLTVTNGAVFTIGQTITVNGVQYVIVNIVGNVLTLDTPLLTAVGTGSLVVGSSSLQIDTGPYAVHRPTLADLEALPPREPVLVDMQARTASYVRSQPARREIALTVLFLATTYGQRRDDYNDFVAALESLSGRSTLRWVGADGVTREYEVVALSVSPDAWFYRATAHLVAANPEPTVVAA